MLGYKVNLGKFKTAEILSNIFSDHKAMRSEINYKKKKKKERTKSPAKTTNTGKLNNLLLNGQWISEEVTEEIKIPKDKWKRKHNNLKTYGTQQKQCEEGSS